MQELAKQAMKVAETWSKEPFDAETRREVQALIDANDIETIVNRFGDSLHFGTAGLRGVMGAGSTMMNAYMIAKATRALALCLLEEYGQEAADRGVVLGYDCRHRSQEFAHIAASVLAAAGIRVYLFDRLSPTPLVPFAVLQKKAFAGVMITSSHNPKKYNGYKLFWSNGAQIVAPVDSQVASRMDRLADIGHLSMSLEEGLKLGRIEMLSDSMIDAFIEWVRETAVQTGHNDVTVVYTPLGGTGLAFAKKAFDAAGFKKLHVVQEESHPDPDFAGLDAPNPERSDTWPRALKLAKEVNADIVLANDGDADRLGCAVKMGGDYVVLGGNQIGALMLNYLLENLPQAQRNEQSFALCSVVSSPLTAALCRAYGIDFQETLTGFKWMGNVADERAARGQHFVFAYEEAFGYAFGTARDKDGISTVLLLAELAADCKAKGKTIADVLKAIYLRCGIHREGAAEKFYEGISGQETMRQRLAELRRNPPKHIAGVDVVRVRDLLESVSIDLASQKRSPVIHLPKQDMLSFYLSDGSWISFRPSGTEPKLKAYIGVIDGCTEADYEAVLTAADQRLEKLCQTVEAML